MMTNLYLADAAFICKIKQLLRKITLPLYIRHMYETIPYANIFNVKRFIFDNSNYIQFSDSSKIRLIHFFRDR
jgi:hypothetical protein